MNVKLQRRIDWVVGGILCSALRLLPKAKKLDSPKSIAFVKLWALGESIITLPMLAAIHNKYPDAKITVIARGRNKAVYECQPFIDEVISLRQSFLRKFDVVLDGEPYLNISALVSFWISPRRIGFSHGIRAGIYTDKVEYNDEQHATLTYMDLAGPLGIKGKPKRLIPLAYPKKAVEEIDSFLNENNVKERIVGICPGVAESSKSRMWLPERWASVADQLIEKYKFTVVFVGVPAEKKPINKIIGMMKHPAINVAGHTSIKGLFCFVKKCSLFLSTDTGTMHVAAAQGVKTIGLFGPNTPVRWAPYGPGNISIYKPLFQKPCINTHLGMLPDCNDHDHMSKIMVKDVMSTVRKML